jgi:hypothetical protein
MNRLKLWVYNPQLFHLRIKDDRKDSVNRRYSLFAGVISGLFFLYCGVVQAQVIDLISGINFGSLDFAQTYNTHIQLGTNGNLNISGSGVASGGGEVAGHVRITLPDTGIIEIKCTSQAQLFDVLATPLTIDNIEISVGSGVNFGSAAPCNGVGAGDAVATTIDMDVIPDPDIFIGGEIMILSPVTLPSDHVYNTTGGGTPITLSVVVQ